MEILTLIEKVVKVHVQIIITELLLFITESIITWVNY